MILQNNNTILLVEDDLNLSYLLRENLTSKGFSVTLATTGEHGLQLIQNNEFDICIFDVMLPEVDGFSLARQFKKLCGNRPFIFLTARVLEKDKIEGFEIGADDYVVKPFSFKELYFRISAILRRTTGNLAGADAVLEIGKHKFHPDQRILKTGKEEKKLSQREAGLLEVLIKNRDNYVTRSQILKTVWGNDDYFTGKSMEVYITKLRKLLKDDPQIEIENLYGTGYRIKYNEPL